MRLGFALVLGSVHFLGAFLPGPLDVLSEIVAHVATQLGIDDLSNLSACTTRKMTDCAHP